MCNPVTNQRCNPVTNSFVTSHPTRPDPTRPLTTVDASCTHLQTCSCAKLCHQCNTVKPLSDFYRCARNRDGRAAQCVACRKRYLANSLPVRQEAQRRWRAANPTRVGKTPRAKATVREKTLSQYGMSISDYWTMLEAQGGGCGICGGEQVIAGQRLAIDHDHNTGGVRGLLCNRCNIGIGMLGDSVESVQRAVVYLTRSTRASRCMRSLRSGVSS